MPNSVTVDSPAAGCIKRDLLLTVSGTYHTDAHYHKTGDLNVYVELFDASNTRFYDGATSGNLPDAVNGGNWSKDITLPNTDHPASYIKAQLRSGTTALGNPCYKYGYDFMLACPRTGNGASLLFTEPEKEAVAKTKEVIGRATAHARGTPAPGYKATGYTTGDYYILNTRQTLAVVERRYPEPGRTPDQWAITNGHFTGFDGVRLTFEAFVPAPPKPPEGSGITYWYYFLLIDEVGVILAPTNDAQQLPDTP